MSAQGTPKVAGRTAGVSQGINQGTAKATPKGFNVISSFEVDWGEKQHWAHPSISDGRLYIRHGSVMKVYDISAKGTRPSGTPKKKQKKVDFY